MNYKSYILMIFMYVLSLNANILLEEPASLSSGDIAVLEKKWQTSFAWASKGISFCFVYENNQAGFALKVLGVPVYFYHYRLLPRWNELDRGLFGRSYYFTTPLKITDPRPKHILYDELVSFLKDKKYIFYTGAGISASKVASMAALEESLQLDKGFFKVAKLFWFDRKRAASIFDQFCRSAIFSEPTAAHYALKDIAKRRKIAIVTENIDLLQQRTGVEPIHAYSDRLLSVTKEEWKEVDAILCLGLSQDDRGMLAWYRKHNPNGMLIAINQTMPSYLSEDDLFLSGDLQEILPNFAEKICAEPSDQAL